MGIPVSILGVCRVVHVLRTWHSPSMVMLQLPSSHADAREYLTAVCNDTHAYDAFNETWCIQTCRMRVADWVATEYMCRRKFPLFISQDGTPVHEATQRQAQSYEEVNGKWSMPPQLQAL